MEQEQRHGARAAPALVDEMKARFANAGREMSEGIEPCLVRAPVVTRLPVADESRR